ncbi:15190_t:CDS:2 [Funneliformis geosporum]|uniref:15190_t:CDS:1 n=1 Tax=Funneliformis geosporum TaxID=1117311 RepID=A0A9W4SUV9_9GLOM|nr:15190_t:CDS:2 [Funneliformis geosporum]
MNIPEDFRLGDGKKITKKDFGYLLKIQGTLLSGDEEEVRLGSEGDELNELELPIWDSFVKVIFQASLVLDLIVNKEYEDAKTQLEILKTCENEAIPKFINIQSNPEAKSKYPTLAKYISEDFQTYSQVLERSLDLSESREWQSKSGSHASHIPPPLSSKSGFETFDDFSLHSGYSRKSSKSGSDSSGTSMATANEEILKTISEKIKELQAKEVSEKEPDKKIELITEQEEQEYNEIKNVDESKVFLDKIRSKFQETGQTLTFKILEELIIEYLELLEFSKKFKTMFEQK